MARHARAEPTAPRAVPAGTIPVVDASSVFQPTSVAASPSARAAALVRDVILGGQDGLVNVLGLVLGMAAATGDARVVVTAGLAALLAESIAMGGVAFTASGAERQLGRTLRDRLEEERAGRVAARRVARRERLATADLPPTVAATAEAEIEREAAAWATEVELVRTTLAPVRETRPVRAALVVGLSTAAGSAIPLLPFVLLPLSSAPIVALAVSAVVLALAGAERAGLTGGRRLRSALEMVGIGLVSALAGYLIGQLLQAPAA
jgi:VIT1/CCC1 family predicted Fe2+/Mn2+ transporter